MVKMYLDGPAPKPAIKQKSSYQEQLENKLESEILGNSFSIALGGLASLAGAGLILASYQNEALGEHLLGVCAVVPGVYVLATRGYRLLSEIIDYRKCLEAPNLI